MNDRDVRVTKTHRELAYRKLNKNNLPGPDDHCGQAWIDLGTDGGPPSFHSETVLAYGIAWGEHRAAKRLEDLPDWFSAAQFVSAGLSLEQASIALMVSRRILEDRERAAESQGVKP